VTCARVPAERAPARKSWKHDTPHLQMLASYPSPPATCLS